MSLLIKGTSSQSLFDIWKNEAIITTIKSI